MDGGAWWATVHGVAKSRTRLSDFTFTFHFHALEKEMATHSSILAWRIPGTGEPAGLPSVGSHRVGHDWSDLAAAAAVLLLAKCSVSFLHSVLLLTSGWFHHLYYLPNQNVAIFGLISKGTLFFVLSPCSHKLQMLHSALQHLTFALFLIWLPQFTPALFYRLAKGWGCSLCPRQSSWEGCN